MSVSPVLAFSDICAVRSKEPFLFLRLNIYMITTTFSVFTACLASLLSTDVPLCDGHFDFLQRWF